MKINVKNGRIVRIEDDSLNPTLPNSDLSFVKDKDLYKEIRNYIRNDHHNLKHQPTFEGGVMKGSNPYLAVAVDMFCRENIPEYRLARQIDLEHNLELTRGTYNDSGLVLRNLTKTNSEKAKYLFGQLEQRGISENNFPLWIQLRGLNLDNNLNFNLTDESVYSTENSLNWESGTKYSKVNNLGLPKEKDSNSNRQIWTSDNALSRCHLDDISDLSSGSSGLSGSNDDGRVVLARARKIGGPRLK